MVWSQSINPLGSLGLSALIAGIPVIFLFIALIALAQAYIFPWMIPSALAAASAASEITEGGTLILAVTGTLVLVLAFAGYRVKGHPAVL